MLHLQEVQHLLQEAMQVHLQVEVRHHSKQPEAPPPHEGATVALHQLLTHHVALHQEVVVEDKKRKYLKSKRG